MWTPAARAQLARASAAYATSLTDGEWALVAPFLPVPAKTGRFRRWSLRRVLDAILHVLRTGGAWRHLPREFPPWPTVHRWFLRLSHTGVFERLAHALTMADRERAGRSSGAEFQRKRPTSTLKSCLTGRRNTAGSEDPAVLLIMQEG